MRYTESFGVALAYAADAHRDQRRKGAEIPYVSHLLGVTAIVLDAGGDESEAIAAVLHDVVEDQPFENGGGRARLADVKQRFGSTVADLVEALSDWISEGGGEQKGAQPYRERKAAYQRHVAGETKPSVLLVSAADKLHNALSMSRDYDTVGEALWERFNGSPEDIFWNYDALIAAYRSGVPDARRTSVVDRLEAVVRDLKEKSGRAT